MSDVVRRQVARIVGPHATDECIPWDGRQVPLFRNKTRIPEELQPIATEMVDRHQWVSKGCLSLTLPDRVRGEELGQEVWTGVFKALVTPGQEVRSLHPFVAAVMEYQLIRQVKRRARDNQLEPLEIMTEDGPMERPEVVDRQPEADEQVWRAAAMDTVLSNLDVFDRILVMGFAERISLRALREALCAAGDPRVTSDTPENNIKTYQNTAIRRASKLLLGPARPVAPGRDKR